MLELNLSKAELINISIEEVEKRIQYIQLTENTLYANDLEFMTPLSKVKESPQYEEYLRVLVDIQYGVVCIGKLGM